MLKLGLSLLLGATASFADTVTLTGITTREGKVSALLYFPEAQCGVKLSEGQERIGIKLLHIDLTNACVQIRRNDNDETLRLGGERTEAPVPTPVLGNRGRFKSSLTQAERSTADRQLVDAIKNFNNPGANDPTRAAEFRNKLLEQAALEAKAAGAAPTVPQFAPSDQ
ncbi:MAG TPA: hypothetical protein VMF06_00595 [Candidatus Limnocylindria bacterium]|jgi:hypothetical protein|nr:hypothetical protein [Candidatus Limnocylindria bacterium]